VLPCSRIGPATLSMKTESHRDWKTNGALYVMTQWIADTSLTA
jgi:hypothetical protein